MNTSLRAGVTYCEVAGHLVFLDVAADRYLALTCKADAAFRRVAGGHDPDWSDVDGLRWLVGHGILESSPGPRPAPCEPPVAARDSLLDLCSSGDAGCMVSAARHLATMAIRLRARGLAVALNRLQAARLRYGGPPDASPDEVVRIAAAHRRLSLLIAARDRCLPLSLGLAMHLAAVGGRPSLVFGVQIDPFRAHCWVQVGDSLINERLELASMFTPILVV